MSNVYPIYFGELLTDTLQTLQRRTSKCLMLQKQRSMHRGRRWNLCSATPRPSSLPSSSGRGTPRGEGVNSIKNAIFSLIRAGMWYRLISEYRGQGCIRASPLSCKYLTVGARNAHSTHRSMRAVRSYARLYSTRINNETNIAYRILNFHITRYRIHLAIAAEYFKIKL